MDLRGGRCDRLLADVGAIGHRRRGVRSELPTVADEMREADRQRLRKAFPELGIAIRH